MSVKNQFELCIKLIDINEMKVIIFGTTGYSGRAILAEAVKQGHEVTILVRDASKIQYNNVKIVEGNVMDPEAVASALHHQEAVLQCLGVGGEDLKLSITLPDLSQFIVDQLKQPTFIKQAPCISN